MDTTLPVKRENVLKAYKKAVERGQALLKTLFGGSFFTTNIKDWETYIIPLVTGFEKACEVAGEDPDDEELNSGTVDEIAYKQIKIWIRALNPPDWKADYADMSQYKWWPWFEFVPGSGFRFYDSFCTLASTAASGGSRLCLASKTLSDHLGRTAIEAFNRFLQ